MDISPIIKNVEHFNKWVEDLPYYYNVREEGDYTDFYLASLDEASKQVDRAEEILKEIEIYLRDKI